MNKFNIGFITTPLMAIFTALQTDQVFQYIQIGLTIAVAVVTLAYTIYKWYKQASADNKITIEEVEQLVEDTKEPIKEVVDSIEDINKVNKDIK